MAFRERLAPAWAAQRTHEPLTRRIRHINLRALQRFQSCCTPKSLGQVAFLFKKRPPSHDSGNGYVNSETAPKAQSFRNLPGFGSPVNRKNLADQTAFEDPVCSVDFDSGGGPTFGKRPNSGFCQMPFFVQPVSRRKHSRRLCGLEEALKASSSVSVEKRGRTTAVWLPDLPG
jgi:hypothetical protein